MRPDSIEKRETIRTRLRALGAPPGLADPVAAATQPGFWIVTATMTAAGGFAFVIFSPLLYIAGQVSVELHAEHMEAAREADAILLLDSPKRFASPFVFSWAIFALLSYGYAARLLGRNREERLGLLGLAVRAIGSGSIGRRMAALAIGHRRELPDAEALLRFGAPGAPHALLAIFGALGLATFLMLTYDRATYELISETGVERRRFAAEPTFERLGDVRALGLGCHYSDRKNRAGYALFYDLYFASGAKLSLGDAQPVSGTRIAALERIDAALAAHSVALHREVDMNGRALAHPACFFRYGREAGPDGEARLRRLLRIGELPGDGG